MHAIRPTVLSQADLRRLILAGNMRKISKGARVSYGTVRNAKRESCTISLETAEKLTGYFREQLRFDEAQARG